MNGANGIGSALKEELSFGERETLRAIRDLARTLRGVIICQGAQRRPVEVEFRLIDAHDYVFDVLRRQHDPDVKRRLEHVESELAECLAAYGLGIVVPSGVPRPEESVVRAVVDAPSGEEAGKIAAVLRPAIYRFTSDDSRSLVRPAECVMYAKGARS